VLDQGLREVFGLKTEGLVENEQIYTMRGCMNCTAQLEGVELRDSGTDGTREMYWRNRKYTKKLQL
jgi:hypothetical protein